MNLPIKKISKIVIFTFIFCGQAWAQSPADPIDILGSKNASELLPPGWKINLDSEATERLDPRQKRQLETIGRDWDVERLKDISLPLPIAVLNRPEVFDRFENVKVLKEAGPGGVPTNHGKEYNNGHMVRMMAIKFPNGEVLLPDELEQYEEVKDIAVEFYQNTLTAEEFDNSYLYIQIHQGIQTFNKSQARKGSTLKEGYNDAGQRVGAHVDGFVGPRSELRSCDHTICVCNMTPTEFFNQGFPIEPSTEYQAALQQFDKMADMKNLVSLQNHVVALFDAATVHRIGLASAEEDGKARNFIKFKLTKNLFNQVGNTLNPKLDYSQWSWVSKTTVASEGRKEK